MRASPSGGLPFLALDLKPGFATRRVSIGNVVDAAPLPELHGADAPPVKLSELDGLECLETEDDAYTTQWYDACWRVLFSNPPKGNQATRERVAKKRLASFIGPEGHIERMCAWTHLVGAVGYFLFAAVRPVVGLDTTSLAGKLSTYSSVVVAVVFAVSTGYHTLGTVRWLAPAMRMFDHGAIDLGLAVAAITDMAIVTLDFQNVPWQTMVDAIGVSVVILIFFMYRRIVLPREDTEVAWGDCRLGLFRLQHADFEYSALRSSSYVVLSFGFVSLIPAAWRNLTDSASSIIIVSNGLALLLLIAGLLLDNVLVWPDLLYQDAGKRNGKKPPWLCHNKECGCMMTSHSWWHV